MLKDLEFLSARIADRDPSICGATPRWLLDTVKEFVDGFLAEQKGVEDEKKMKRFVHEMLHYICDEEAGTETEQLAAAFIALLDRL